MLGYSVPEEAGFANLTVAIMSIKRQIRVLLVLLQQNKMDTRSIVLGFYNAQTEEQADAVVEGFLPMLVKTSSGLVGINVYQSIQNGRIMTIVDSLEEGYSAVANPPLLLAKFRKAGVLHARECDPEMLYNIFAKSQGNVPIPLSELKRKRVFEAAEPHKMARTW